MGSEGTDTDNLCAIAADFAVGESEWNANELIVNGWVRWFPVGLIKLNGEVSIGGNQGRVVALEYWGWNQKRIVVVVVVIVIIIIKQLYELDFGWTARAIKNLKQGATIIKTLIRKRKKLANPYRFHLPYFLIQLQRKYPPDWINLPRSRY